MTSNRSFDDCVIDTGKIDEVVISGISGVFPKSDNVHEFMQNLYNKVDMVSCDESRWSSKDLDVPKYSGKISFINKFDAQFFKIGFQLACVVEPMSRKLLEHAYAAIFDSGTNPLDLKGKKVGVFIGAAYTEVSTQNNYEIKKKSNFVINGGSKAMFANRISYWIDGKGPSYTVDYADASSIVCLEHAFKAINAGECDAAIVGASNLCMGPNAFVNIKNAGLLCEDGKTKCFDKTADGYVRSDAVGLVFLQKAKDAKRIYAEITHVKGIYGFKDDAKFIPMHNTKDIKNFLKDFYSEADVDPKNVEYIEAQGTAISEADKNEMIAISETFNDSRTIKIGCVKSNMGCSEAASGICALTKLCLSYHTGQIPANLHYREPQEMNAVKQGRLQVVTENTDFNREYSALNNFSFTGAIFHVLLKGRYKVKDIKKYKSEIPHIVLASGRQESCVNTIFDYLKAKSIDPEEIDLLYNNFSKDISCHTGRGYAILESNQENETVSLGQKVEYYPGIKRPIWFVYSGMGSQWISMGADLMKIPIFADAIKKCHSVLKPLGIDLIHVLTSKDKTVFENSIHAFVGIGAVQIGLTDILKEIGVEPDNIIGHSLGEIACGYQDGSLTKEELILTTYNRGMACANAKLIRGLMAAVGVGYKDIVNKCPPEIDVACHNSSTSVTLSGPEEDVEKFVRQLTEQGIFAKEVKSGNIAYHSRHVMKCGPELLKRLKQVIPNPKSRSHRWLSTSVPRDKWDDPLVKLSSAEYYTNNLLQPVLFEEASEMIPDNAIVVEVAPHGLLQAILKRSHMTCTHVPLTKRGCPDGVKFLLEAIGTLYMNGINPKVDILYPKIEYPVSTETPMLSHLVEWEHSEDWPIHKSKVSENISAQARNVIISVYDDEYRYLEGNIIEGDNILPETALIVLVWETLSMYKGMDRPYQYVVFKDLTFHGQVYISREKPSKLYIMINKGNNQFEVTQEDQLILNGVVNDVKALKFHPSINKLSNEVDKIILSTEDIYRILGSKGYDYRDEFKSIHSSNSFYDKFNVKLTSNWVTFLDSLIQINNIGRQYAGVSVPRFIRKIKINTIEHMNAKLSLIEGIEYVSAEYNDEYDIVRCAGVEIEGITFNDKPIIEHIPDVIENKIFCPYYMTEAVNIKTAIQIFFQIITENMTTADLHVIPLLTTQNSKIYDAIEEFYRNNTLIDSEIIITIEKNIASGLKPGNHTNVIVIENLLDDKKKICNLQKALVNGEFLIAVEQSVPKLDTIIRDYFTIISSMSNGNQILVLLKKTESTCDLICSPITSDINFARVTQVYGELETTKRVVLISERQPYCGLIGFVKDIRRNYSGKFSLLVIDDLHAPKFSPDNDVYKSQLQKNLAINIFKKGQWGGYYYVKTENTKNTSSVYLTSFDPGDLDSLEWVEAPPIQSNDNFVQVHYAGLSLRDIQKASGDIKSDENNFGMDYSGIDKNGNRVMGVVANGAVSNTIVCDPHLLWPVPVFWTMEEAATVPLPYLQAYYCLTIRSQLKRHQSVLITNGAQALGQAIIAICLALDCTIYVTVNNLVEKDFLLRIYPQLSDNYIGLNDDYFFSIVKSNSQIGGCSFVINSYSGPLREAVMKLVGFMGCFMDLNLYDAKNNHNIGMDFIKGDRSYKAVDISNIFRPENVKDKKILQGLLSEGVRKGIVRPLTRNIYSPKDVLKAFRLLSFNRSKGRIVIRMKDKTTKENFNFVPRINYSSSGVHIVVCDEKGIGIELADKIVQRGAKNVVLIIKQSLITGYLHTKFQSWMKKDVTVKVWNDNISTDIDDDKLLVYLSEIGPIAGILIVQETEIDKDAKQEHITEELTKFGTVVNKLDISTRKHNISYFVVILNKLQSDNQRYTSSLAETICQKRSEIGLPALVIDNKNEDSCSSAKKMSELFKSMEFGIAINCKNIRAYNLKKENSSVFMEKVLKILDLVKITELEENIEINYLKLPENVLELLKKLVKDTYKINYTVEKLQHMTINSLSKLSESLNKNETDFHHGLGAFYSMIEDEFDHVETSQPIIPMVTTLNSRVDITIDPHASYLIMIPGFENRHEIFNTIAERLKIHAVSINLGLEIYSMSSIQQMANQALQYMKSKFIIQSKFYLLGYSFGVNIALEIASMLESQGHVGVVYCLDSSPEALKLQFKSYVGDINGNELENAIVDHIYTLMAGHRNNELSEELKTLDSFSDKVEAFSQRLEGIVNISNQYKKDVLESAFTKINTALEYQPNMKLASELVLIKGIPPPNAVEMSEDYGLSRYTTKPVKVFNIESNHVMVPYDCKVSSIVNKMLHRKILDEYKKRNLCDVYLGEGN